MKKQKSILEKFVDAISVATGLHMCIYDLAYFSLDDKKLKLSSASRAHCSPYCLKIKSNRTGWDRCIKDEYFRAEQAQKRNGPFLHTCHAGLTDLVVPVRCGGKQIGAIYLGQAVTIRASTIKETITRLVTELGFNGKELTRLLANQPPISEGRLKDKTDLLNGLRDYIEMSETILGLAQVPHARAAAAGAAPIKMSEVPTFFLDQLNPQTKVIQRALAIMKTSYWEKISLSQVALQVGISRSHFTREFQRETGFSFRKCLVGARINAAIYLLKRSHLNVGQIAEMIGYEDNSSMTRAFRKQVGDSPRRYLRIQPPNWAGG